jgi:hypothetical protein
MSTTVPDLQNMPLDELKRLTVQFEAGELPVVEPEVVPVVPAVEPPVVEPEKKRFRREIDLEDGSGKQVFEGATLDELVENLANAQKNATKKIREQAAKLKSQEQASKPPTAEERLAAIESQIAWNQTAVEFVGNHPDYENTTANATRMHRYMAAQGIPKTLEGLEQAFNELSESGLLTGKPAPAGAQEEDAQQRIVAAPTTNAPGTKVTSGLTARTGSLAARAAKEELTEKDIKSLSIEDLRKQTKAFFEA